MLKGLTYRRKVYLLIAVFLLLLLLCHSLAFKETLKLKREVRKMKDQLEIVENAPQQIANLEIKIEEIEQVIGKNFNSGEDIQQQILEKISNYCIENKLVVKEFPKKLSSNDQQYMIETNRVVIEGSFTGLLKLLHFLEQDKKIGRVVSVDFRANQDFKTKRTFLTMFIFIQNIKTGTNDKS